MVALAYGFALCVRAGQAIESREGPIGVILAAQAPAPSHLGVADDGEYRAVGAQVHAPAVELVAQG